MSNYVQTPPTKIMRQSNRRRSMASVGGAVSASPNIRCSSCINLDLLQRFISFNKCSEAHPGVVDQGALHLPRTFSGHDIERASDNRCILLQVFRLKFRLLKIPWVNPSVPFMMRIDQQSSNQVIEIFHPKVDAVFNNYNKQSYS